MARSNRNTELGDQACFCTQCGWARRFFPGVITPPEQCPHCEAPVVSACPSCGESILSTMAVDCDVCGAQLRAPKVAGVQIRRPKRLPVVQPPAASSGDGCCSS